jgi:uncharacterized DUF497 family protein
MPYYLFLWTEEDDGNVRHIAEHGVTPDEAESVVRDPLTVTPNRRRPERLFAKGFTRRGRLLGVSYEMIDASTVYIITAYEIEL